MEALQNRERCLKYLEGCKEHTNPEALEAVRLSVIALREKLERENPKPLTLDELRQMDGEPVWITFCSPQDVWPGHWRIWHTCEYQERELEAYDKVWQAYRRKPDMEEYHEEFW